MTNKSLQFEIDHLHRNNWKHRYVYWMSNVCTNVPNVRTCGVLMNVDEIWIILTLRHQTSHLYRFDFTNIPVELTHRCVVVNKQNKNTFTFVCITTIVSSTWFSCEYQVCVIMKSYFNNTGQLKGYVLHTFIFKATYLWGIFLYMFWVFKQQDMSALASPEPKINILN